MENRLVDWKDIASTYYDKCLALTILLLLFTFMVFPNVESRSIKVQAKEIEAIDIMQEEEQKIEQPTTAEKPVVNIEIVDSDDVGSDENIETVETIEVTKLDMNVTLAAPQDAGTTSKLVVYDDPPVPTKTVSPVFPDFEKKMKIQGTVVLDVEVLANGNVGAIEVVKSVSKGLDEAAISAMRQTKFQPAKSNGKAVAVWMRYPISFTLTK